MKPIKIIVFTFLSSFFIFQSVGHAYKAGRQYTLSGKTMGTFYTIKFISTRKESIPSWQSRVDTLLRDVNQKLSMYDPTSELSRFNRQGVNTLLTVSPDFFAMLTAGKKLYAITNGAWDGTVKPLVDLWGFGTTKQAFRVPELEKITRALALTGFDNIHVQEPHTVLKHKPVTLDLGSIAKGYGVDAIAELFASSGIADVLVEIGGELYGAGKNKKGAAWSVGISSPNKKFAGQNLYKIVRLHNQAIATSGNYRNFFDLDGKTFSHIIDPKTGLPVTHKIVSASVISKGCAFADGLATALMVMDVTEGIRLINSLEHTECLILQKNGQTLVPHVSENFDALVVE